MRAPVVLSALAAGALVIAASVATGLVPLGGADPVEAAPPVVAERPAVVERPVVGPYVALGDSYTSSPFTGPPAGAPPGCQRSTNNYPHVAAETLGVALTDVSCGGARTADLAGEQTTGQGTNPPQYDALGADTRLVTIGIGGNDIGFGEIVQSCLSPTPAGTPCRDRYTGGGTDELRERIDGLEERLDDVLDEVAERAPDARVALVGYPSILPVEGPGCYPAVPITPGDVEYLRGVVSDLNTRIAGSAADGDAEYVDTLTPTAGHDVCTAPGVRWIEGLLPAAPAAPFHPNAAGSDAVGRAVAEALRAPVPVAPAR